MPELPLCTVEWPGLNTYFDAYMGLGHGTQPGKCVIICPAQNNPIAAFGDLVWRAGKTAIKFPACRVDKLESGIDPQRGQIWQITILDRRWRWRFGRVRGRYNIREGNLAIRKGTRRDVRELAEACLKALGETHYDVSKMPLTSAKSDSGFLYPEVHWDPPTLAAVALEQLCEMTACRVVPYFTKGTFDAVRIVPMGEGDDLPKTDLEFHVGVDTAELPDKVGVMLGPTLVDVHLTLLPVISSDLFKTLALDKDALLDLQGENYSLPARYRDPHPGVYPIYDPERPPPPYAMWRGFPPALYMAMQRQPSWWKWLPLPQEMPSAFLPSARTNRMAWTYEMQQKLIEEAMRYWQIGLPFTVPGYGEVKSHDQYILETERAETIEDPRTGVITRTPAYVYGSFNMNEAGGSFDQLGRNSEAVWDQIWNPVDPDMPLIYQGGFQIDNENRLVKFSSRMFRNALEAGFYKEASVSILTGKKAQMPVPQDTGKVDSDGNPIKAFFYEPAWIVLHTAIRLLEPDSRTTVRFTKTKDIVPQPKRKAIDRKNLPKQPDFMTEFSVHEDIELRGKVTYKRFTADQYAANGFLKPTGIEYYNEKECDENADYYLHAEMQHYQTKVPTRARYPGLFPIQLDGAIEEVTYISSVNDGSYTVASRDSEWKYGLLLSYPQRRQMTELWSYREAQESASQEKMARFRNRVLVPSSAGGKFGLSPPG